MISRKELIGMRGKAKAKALKGLMDDLMDNVVQDPEKLAEFVEKWQGGFYHYSFNNMILIMFQKPEASLLAGYKQWQTKYNRQVKKGERAISVLAPRVWKKPVIKADGTEDTEEILYFKPVSVFDITQTEGDPVDVGCSSYVHGDIEYEAVKAACPYKVVEKNMGAANGATDGKTIWITPKENEAAMSATLMHEWGHCKLHYPDKHVARNIKEIEAETVSYIVTTFFGLDNEKAKYYVGNWQNGDHLEHGRGKKILSVAESIIKTVTGEKR